MKTLKMIGEMVPQHARPQHDLHYSAEKVLTLPEMYALCSESGVFQEPAALSCLSDESYPLLYKHIIAEQLLHDGKSKSDAEWMSLGVCDSLYRFYLYQLWCYPLMWTEPPSEWRMIVDGRLAIEQWADRDEEIESVLSTIHQSELLALTDNSQPTFKLRALIQDDKEVLAAIRSGENVKEAYKKLIPFSITRLVENLVWIELKKGGKCALELWERLTKALLRLKAQNEYTYQMSSEKVHDFEEAVRNGFSDYIERWKNESVTRNEKVSSSISERGTPEYCKYIVVEKFMSNSSYSIENYEQVLHDASKGKAVHFVSKLLEGEKSGYLNFKRDSRQEILKYFQDHFKDMRKYSYQNFNKAYNSLF